MKTRANHSRVSWIYMLAWVCVAMPCAWADVSNMNPTNKHAWGENVGWVRFQGSAPDYNMRTLAFDKQPLGTPNWWLALYNVTENYDEGDAVPAWKEYVADTDPTTAASYFNIASISNLPAATVYFPSSSRRYYTPAARQLAGGGLDECYGSDRHSGHRRARFVAGHECNPTAILPGGSQGVAVVLPVENEVQEETKAQSGRGNSQLPPPPGSAAGCSAAPPQSRTYVPP